VFGLVPGASFDAIRGQKAALMTSLLAGTTGIRSPGSALL
jgi:hypothetical protein